MNNPKRHWTIVELRAVVHGAHYRYTDRERQNARDALVALARQTSD